MQALSKATPGETYTIQWMFGQPEVLDFLHSHSVDEGERIQLIQKLIVHIPEKHFKMLRYYGVYAKHHKQEKKLLVLEVYHKKRHKQRHGESNILSFVMSFFISSLLYTISDDLRNFL